MSEAENQIEVTEAKNEPTVECRACLQILNADCVLYNIFDCWTPPWDGMENSIAEDLAKIANIQISESDRHSKIICETCCQLLLSACSFAAVVKKNDEILQQRYGEDKAGPNLSNDRVWPKPIQVDKSIANSMYENVDIKQEILSDEEHEYPTANGPYNTSTDDIPNLDIIKIEPEEIIQQQPLQMHVTVNGSDTVSEYESGATGPLLTKNVRKKCVTTYSRQDFKPSETQSTVNESRSHPVYIDHVQKPRQIIGVRLKKAPKTSAERVREFRARKALLKQQSKQQQELDAMVEIATEDIRPSEIRTIEKCESSKKQAKTAAQRMREYRKRKKL
ncbi:unnamed protein product [Euphydryas editha]|uniref:ZAD domain-containing protein n=1 Tax=Euphydryas editha TaxID=104508 RepID=A0AAU9URP4_EUPED|nr:unnamed protein product [Euphydryas editha]